MRHGMDQLAVRDADRRLVELVTSCAAQSRP
jgi:hypothetical protein